MLTPECRWHINLLLSFLHFDGVHPRSHPVCVEQAGVSRQDSLDESGVVRFRVVLRVSELGASMSARGVVARLGTSECLLISFCGVVARITGVLPIEIA